MTIPPDLRGRRRRDPFWVAVNAVYNGVQRVRGLREPVLPDVRPVDRTLRLTVVGVRPEAEDVVSVRFGAVDGRLLPRWQPGCHLDVTLPSGRRRQYSLCGDPADRRTYRIAVRRLPGGDGGSVEVHTLRPGAVVTSQGPRNAFPFLASERYLFVAGGIGITPILPMVKAADRAGADWRLLYTGRTRASLPFLDELPAGLVTVRTDDEHGLPSGTDLVGDVGDGTAVYCCGPAPMIESVRASVPEGAALHFERFAPPPVIGGEPFEIELRRSGRTVAVPADRSALDAIRDVLPGVAYSCRQGFCGTCRTAVLAGEADLCSPADRDAGSMLICVSRASAGGRITLDL
ncbi:PDR/VanB family oxidoreductase [Actinomadura fibrosa]|uniref:PDR/VanB family oxidoreductase n=1 Tax=Actinomadura fibrosa TaxID=111802 RepID=A0ABW2Y2X7_9ACTN|nr:PDR/VanB family oxidoreductase [Actinomadura fibrosa]